MDDDHSGELDISEVKVALKALEAASRRKVQEDAAAQARADKLREKAAANQPVIDATRSAETAAREVEEQRGNSVAANLGMIFKKKGREKMRQLVEQHWGNENGDIDQVKRRSSSPLLLSLSLPPLILTSLYSSSVQSPCRSLFLPVSLPSYPCV